MGIGMHFGFYIGSGGNCEPERKVEFETSGLKQIINEPKMYEVTYDEYEKKKIKFGRNAKK